MLTLGRLAESLGARLEGPADLRLRGVAPVESAAPDEVTFVKDERHLVLLPSSKAGAVICRPGDDVRGRPALRVENPRLSAARAVALFVPAPPAVPGVHPKAWVAPDAVVPPSCEIGPFAAVEPRAVLGERVVLGAGAVVGAGARVGDETRLDARVVLYPGVTLGKRCHLHAGVVIGAPGFGFEPTRDGPVGFPQHGTVVLGDDVRIGANSTVDRATFRATTLGNGVKLDNLVQVSHNVTIGPGVLICALSGIGGGSKIGRNAILGPQTGMSPEAVLGESTTLGARGSIATSQRCEGPGQVFMGDTPMPLADWKRWQIVRLRAGRRRGSAPGPA